MTKLNDLQKKVEALREALDKAVYEAEAAHEALIKAEAAYVALKQEENDD